MTLTEALLLEIDEEAISTRKTLACVPDDKLDYQPHAKSMTLGRLAGHIAENLQWATWVLETPSFDVAPDGKSLYTAYAAPSQKDLLEHFDANLDHFRKALAATNDSALAEPWSLLNNGKAFFTLPRSVAIRRFCFNHAIHHRGQLGVYLRLLDVPVPGVYGPSQDDKDTMAK